MRLVYLILFGLVAAWSPTRALADESAQAGGGKKYRGQVYAIADTANGFATVHSAPADDSAPVCQVAAKEVFLAVPSDKPSKYWTVFTKHGMGGEMAVRDIHVLGDAPDQNAFSASSMTAAGISQSDAPPSSTDSAPMTAPSSADPNAPAGNFTDVTPSPTYSDADNAKIADLKTQIQKWQNMVAVGLTGLQSNLSDRNFTQQRMSIDDQGIRTAGTDRGADHFHDSFNSDIHDLSNENANINQIRAAIGEVGQKIDALQASLRATPQYMDYSNSFRGDYTMAPIGFLQPGYQAGAPSCVHTGTLRIFADSNGTLTASGDFNYTRHIVSGDGSTDYTISGTITGYGQNDDKSIHVAGDFHDSQSNTTSDFHATMMPFSSKDGVLTVEERKYDNGAFRVIRLQIDTANGVKVTVPFVMREP